MLSRFTICQFFRSFTNKVERSNILTLSICLFLLSILPSFIGENNNTSLVKSKFVMDLDTLYYRSKNLTNLIRRGKTHTDSLQNAFYNVKSAYKEVEYLLEYLDPEIAKKLNGAPVPTILVEQEEYLASDNAEPSVRTFSPLGLQVLEETLFSDSYTEEDVKTASYLAFAIQEQSLLFINSFNNQPLTDKQVLESAREELIRIMTLGITGFDAPAAGKEIDFCAIALEPLIHAVSSYQNHSNQKVVELSGKAVVKLDNALNYLKENNDFDTFNRVYFIRELANPAYALITDLQTELLGGTPSISRPVNPMSKGLFDKDFLQSAYFAKQDQKVQKQELRDLGKLLFFDPLLSSNNQRSCASCHNPSKAFTDGVAKSTAFDFKGTVSRNSPTLINSVFSNDYFWDSRAQYLQDQVPAVLQKADELHGTYDDVIKKLSQSKEYRKLFKKAFSENIHNTINTNTINRAIAAYVQSLVAIDSDFDKYMRGEKVVLDESVKRGFNLFMGKAGCGTCHFAPTFNGTVPPRFIDSESEILGVPDHPDLKMAKLDSDSGKAAVIPAEALMHAFKTPTVRNIELTAPYMHNGVFGTLEEVMEFYDLGGGAALGFDIPNQTLPADPLGLTDKEKNDIISFMKSLTDTTSIPATPVKLPAFGRKSEFNSRVVGGVY